MATVALEDWSMSVSKVPSRRKSSTERKPRPDQLRMKPSTSGLWLRSGIELFIRERPRKRRLNPMTNSLMLRNLSFLERLSRKPSAIMGTAMALTSALKPKMEMIQAVIVVPMFAPIITPMAWARVSSPALTKPTTITVVALEDWTSAVTPSPESIPLNGLEVIVPRSFLILPPAAFCMPELIMFIP